MNIQESIHPNTKIFHKSQAANDVIDIYWEPNQGLISRLSSRHGHLHFMEKVAIDAVESQACPPRRVCRTHIHPVQEYAYVFAACGIRIPTSMRKDT